MFNVFLCRRHHKNPLQDLWLSIFTNHDLCHFTYEQIAKGNTGDVNPGTVRQTVSNFHCKFPFFWLIKETIDAKWDLAYTIAGIVIIASY